MKYTVAELADVFSGVLGDLAAVFTAEGQPWMLVGDLAVGGWTEPRATRDCDFAVALPDDHGPLIAALRRIGFAVSVDDLAGASEGGPVRMHLQRPDAPPHWDWRPPFVLSQRRPVRPVRDRAPARRRRMDRAPRSCCF